MKHLIFSVFMFIFHYSFCQQLNWVKEHDLIDEAHHFGNLVSTDKHNNTYISTIFKGTYTTLNRSGSRIRKYDHNGNLKWEVYKTGEVFGMVTDSMGNSYITGTFSYNFNTGCGVLVDSSFYQTMFLAKLDSNGNCLWSKMINNAYGSKMAIDKSGQAIYIIGGNNTYGTAFGCASPQNQGFHYISKFDTEGNCIWLKPTLTWRYISNLAVNDNYVAVTGQFDRITYLGIDSSYAIGKNETDYIYNTYTALYDLDGNLKWAKVTGDYSDDVQTNSIALDDSNNVYVTGNFYNNVKLAGRHFSILQWKDIFIVKYNEQGDTVFTTTWPGTSSEEGRALFANQNGIYFSGTCYGQLTIGDTTINPGKVSIVLAKMSFDLKKTEWIKTFGSSGSHAEIFQITSDSDNNIIAVGDYTNDLQLDNVLLTYGNGFKKPFVLSLKDNSNVVSVKANTLKQNNFNVYPNPSSDSFVFEYKSDAKEKISAVVYNSAGKVVFRKEYPAFAGELKDSFDLSGVTNGIYLLEISSGNKKETKTLSVSH